MGFVTGDNILGRAVLVLNSGMIPIEICTVRKAVLDIFREVAVPIAASSDVLRSPSVVIPAPSIIARTGYHKIPRRDPALNKWNILQRDRHACVYCRKRFPAGDLTIDHVVPRSRWKKVMGAEPPYEFNSWRNVVTACRRCNSVKGSRLLSEIGWKLEAPPEKPGWMPALVIPRLRAERMGWMDYCGFNVQLVEGAIRD